MPGSRACPTCHDTFVPKPAAGGSWDNHSHTVPSRGSNGLSSLAQGGPYCDQGIFPWSQKSHPILTIVKISWHCADGLIACSPDAGWRSRAEEGLKVTADHSASGEQTFSAKVEDHAFTPVPLSECCSLGNEGEHRAGRRLGRRFGGLGRQDAAGQRVLLVAQDVGANGIGGLLVGQPHVEDSSERMLPASA
jgi:hypothetical protein